MAPGEGVRFLLERGEVAGDQASATYAASILTPRGRHELAATLWADGRAELAPTSEPSADAADLKRLDGIARTVARAAAKNRAEGLPAWPARILRWRGPGRG
ncbi:MAG TPA: hypothetical protein VFG83_06050 [Kofleriaceae bacterium]|nr:hypothetical protein [Kofleriaceae bacterium]